MGILKSNSYKKLEEDNPVNKKIKKDNKVNEKKQVVHNNSNNQYIEYNINQIVHQILERSSRGRTSIDTYFFIGLGREHAFEINQIIKKIKEMGYNITPRECIGSTHNKYLVTSGTKSFMAGKFYGACDVSWKN